MMIRRDLYLKKLEMYAGRDVVKLIIGMRRTGKTTILHQFIDELRAEGVPEENIVYINFASSINNGKFSVVNSHIFVLLRLILFVIIFLIISLCVLHLIIILIICQALFQKNFFLWQKLTVFASRSPKPANFTQADKHS